VEGQAHAEDSRLLAPTVDVLPALGLFDRQSSRDREAMRVEAGCFQGYIIGISFPGGRHGDGLIHIRGIHLLYQLIHSQRHRAMGIRRPIR
jgi:hypothetical protein